MTRAEPERHNGVAYTRIWLRDGRARPSRAQFKVDYDLPMENVVDYKLGGAEGTFLFDPDHTVMTADSPHFTRFIEKGVEHIVLGWDHVVFLIILLLGASKLRDVLELATAFTVAHSVTLALAHPRRGQHPGRDRRAADRRVDRLRGGDAGARGRDAQEAASSSSPSASCTGSASPAR